MAFVEKTLMPNYLLTKSRRRGTVPESVPLAQGGAKCVKGILVVGNTISTQFQKLRVTVNATECQETIRPKLEKKDDTSQEWHPVASIGLLSRDDLARYRHMCEMVLAARIGR